MEHYSFVLTWFHCVKSIKILKMYVYLIILYSEYMNKVHWRKYSRNPDTDPHVVWLCSLFRPYKIKVNFFFFFLISLLNAI